MDQMGLGWGSSDWSNLPLATGLYFRMANECLTTLSLTVFTQSNFVADFLQAKCDFTPKTDVLRFSPPLGELRGNVRCTS